MRLPTVYVLALVCLSAASAFGQNTLTCSPNPSTVGAPVVMSARFAAADQMVNFTDGNSSIGTALTQRGGSATITVSTLSLGSHQIQASIVTGDPNFPTTNMVTQVVTRTPVSISATASPNSGSPGQAITLTANVSPSAATGSVTFLEGAAIYGSAPLANGTATFSISSLSTGTHTLEAFYPGDANYGSNSTTLTVTIIPPTVSTITMLTSSPNPSAQGQVVILTASVSQPAATGVVTFLDNGNQIGSQNLANGTANFPTSTLSVGTHTLAATYAGDATYSRSSSNTVTQTVTRVTVSTALALLSSANPSALCQPVTLTATLTPSNATGNVTFLDSTATLGTINVTNGSASLSVPSLTAGTHSIQAGYNPDAGFGGSSMLLSQVVSGSTTVTLSSAPNPSNLNQTVNMAVTVSSAACAGVPPPGGIVTFFDGTNQLGSSNVASGTATFATSTLAAGNHSLNARYSGDTNYSPNNSNTFTQVVNGKTPTITVLTPSATSITTTQSLTLTASVTPAGATGQVQFKDGANVIGTPTLSAGTATLTLPGLPPAGVHTLTAVYLGDSNFGTSPSNTVNENVTNTITGTSTTLAASANPIATAQSLTLSATVSPSGATGQVQFLDGGTVKGTSPLNGGTATFPIGNLTPGTHALSAVYVGDANFGTSTSNTVSETVSGPPVFTTLSVNPNPANVGQTVTLSAAVTPASASGSVQFLDGGALLRQTNLVNGSATLQWSTFTAGSHTLTAQYLGDSVNASSTSQSVNLTVNRQSTATNLSPSSNPVNSGQSLTLTAAVTPAGATGQVQFSDGSTPLGTGAVSGGIASYTTPNLSIGTHSLSASYSGDGNFGPSASQVVNESVSQPPPTSVVTSASLSVTPTSAKLGQVVTMNASVTPSNATGAVIFSDNGATLVSVPLSNGTASFATSSLPAGSHTIVAVYEGTTSGNPTFNSSSSNPATLVVSSTVTQTTLSTSPTTSTFGQAVILNASVTTVNASGTPTGTITFNDGSNTVGTVPLTSSGAASFSISTLAVGPHSLISSYSGDATFTQSSSLPASVQVNKATTTSVLTPTPTSSTLGQPVVLTARVTPPAATGTVTFMDGASAIGVPVAVAEGSATTTTASLSTGNHTLTAIYSGDSSYSASTSPAASESVGLTGTTTNLSVSPVSSLFGQAVTLTATLNAPTATGTVTFLDGTAPLGTQALSNGSATFATTVLSTGTHSLTAVYSGDSKFAHSTSSPPAIQTVSQAVSSTSLSSSPNPSLPSQQVTLRATVTPAAATGTVTFLDGTATIGTQPLSNGTASMTTATLATGSHSLTALFSGDANYSASTSTAAIQVVTPTVTPLGSVSPAVLPAAIVGIPYSQAFIVDGGSAPLTWSLAAGSVPGLTISPAGVLSGTPATAGTTQLTVRVQDNGGSAAAAVLSLTVLPLPTVSISAPSVKSTADQPVPQAVLSTAYSLPLTATFTLSFTADAANLPADYTEANVKFIGGSTTSDPVSIPANTTDAVMLPALQVGTVAGTITVRLATLTTSTGQSVLPASPPITTIVVGRFAPEIVSGSTKIVNVTASGFSVVLDGTSTPRDLTSANLTFTSASGAQLNGGQFTVSLTGAAAAWFPDTGGDRGVANGGAFSLTLPFSYSGDTSAIGTVSVTLTNSAGTSPAVSGGR